MVEFQNSELLLGLALLFALTICRFIYRCERTAGFYPVDAALGK